MTWRARATRYLARFDRFPWLLIAVTTAVLLLAVAASVVAYLSVAQALTTPSLAASFEPRYVGTASNGSLLDRFCKTRTTHMKSFTLMMVARIERLQNSIASL